MNKYEYFKVIQQNYGQGWEDVSFYETKSNFINFDKSGQTYVDKFGKERELSLINHDLREYRLTGYATRVIKRKVKLIQ